MVTQIWLTRRAGGAKSGAILMNLNFPPFPHLAFGCGWWPRVSTGLALACLAALTGANALAEVRLPAIFSTHMVLQAGKSVPVWGWADPGEKVSVSVAGKTQHATADAQGRWRVKFSGLKAGGPFTLAVHGKNEVVVDDVLVGEVWLGSGQSNMAQPAREARDFATTQAEANAPEIRMFKVESKGATNAQSDCAGTWQVCNPETVGRFSAVLYFFGKELHAKLGGPVGLINSSVGATAIESWISPAGQPAQPGDGKGDLYNGKIAPLVPYGLRGIIWYQGEANAHSAEQARRYHGQMVALVRDWRAHWEAELPFGWVQLPNYHERGEAWCLVREGQLQALELPRTGMAITVDLGDAGNIHPKNKQGMAARLALWALGTVYDRKVPATSGPLPAKTEFRRGTAVVKFQHADGGLAAREGELRGFQIAAADQMFQPATARIQGQTVIVSSPAVTQPAAVRYAWQDNPEANLVNGAGLPATPFRTDNWQ